MFNMRRTNVFKPSYYLTTYQLVKAYHEKKESFLKNTKNAVNSVNIALLLSNFIVNGIMQNKSISPLYFYVAIAVNTMIGTLFYRLSIKKLRKDFSDIDKSRLDKHSV